MRLHQPQLHRAQSEHEAQPGWLAATHPARRSALGPLHLLLALLQAASRRACAAHMGHMGSQAHVTSPRSHSCLNVMSHLSGHVQVIFSAVVLCHVISSIEFPPPLPALCPPPPW